jgi:hypothetical protein
LQRCAVCFWLRVLRAFSGGLDYLFWLISKCLCHLLMALLYFVVGKVQLGLARLVRGNLRCIRSSLVFLREMFLDLLAART